MFQSRKLNQNISKIQEKALRITYKDSESSFSELLQKDCAVTIHTKNLHILMSNMQKTRNELNPSFKREIFRENTIHYYLRNNNEFRQPTVRRVNNGTESVRFKGACPQLCPHVSAAVSARVRSCGKRYNGRYGIQNPFVNLKQR